MGGCGGHCACSTGGAQQNDQKKTLPDGKGSCACGKNLADCCHGDERAKNEAIDELCVSMGEEGTGLCGDDRPLH